MASDGQRTSLDDGHGARMSRVSSPMHPLRAAVFLVAFLVITALGVMAVFAGGTVRAAIGVAALPGDAGREPDGGAALGDGGIRGVRHEALLPAGTVQTAAGAGGERAGVAPSP